MTRLTLDLTHRRNHLTIVRQVLCEAFHLIYQRPRDHPSLRPLTYAVAVGSQVMTDDVKRLSMTRIFPSQDASESVIYGCLCLPWVILTSLNVNDLIYLRTG